MEDLHARPLDQAKIERLQRTMSSDALWLVVMHNILTKKGMSVLRTGDLDSLFLMRYPVMQRGPIQVDDGDFSEANLSYLGVLGIDRDEMFKRVMMMAKADYLGMHISGYLLPAFDMSPWISHPRLVDNYFSNNWTKPMIRQLLERADGVTVINRDKNIANQIIKRIEVKKGHHVEMNTWRDTLAACKQACDLPHQLVILSGGSAGKYIAIELAAKGKVVLDVGQSAWCFF